MRTGAARGYVGNFHEAGFYGSDAALIYGHDGFTVRLRGGTITG